MLLTGGNETLVLNDVFRVAVPPSAVSTLWTRYTEKLWTVRSSVGGRDGLELDTGVKLIWKKKKMFNRWKKREEGMNEVMARATGRVMWDTSLGRTIYRRCWYVVAVWENLIANRF